MKPKFIQYRSRNNKKITMINLPYKVYNKINIKQNKYFCCCGEKEKIFLQ